MSAIDYLQVLKKSQTGKYAQKWLNEAIEALEQKSEWIPVSERLPEIGQRILISQTTEYGHRIEIGRYDRWGFLMGIVDAWMPLPEPYKAESEEKYGNT